ncbi:MAG: molybdenum ABC transporter ATP-binding protein [Verrucomicrobiales bacterium]|nr:molybdenum ABC transporter ATP-binding protein [Verrucomicrobiales bacterium]
MSLILDILVRRGSFDLSVDTEFASKGVTAVFGPSGCGKTTLLRSIAGLENSIQGKIHFRGRAFHEGLAGIPPHTRDLAFVFQEPALFPHLSVEGNITFGFERVREKTPLIGVSEAAELTGVTSYLKRSTNQLSGGEKQRVAIAQALASNPALLLMDEPLSGLDASSRSSLLTMLESVFQKVDIPVVYVTHDWKEVLRLADHVVFLQSGRIASRGDIPNILQQVDLPIPEEQSGVTLIEAKVSSVDEEFALSQFSFPGGQLTVPGVDRSTGDTARILIESQDVSIALTASEDSSILNILPATVKSVAITESNKARVTLDIGSTILRAQVTRKSVKKLGLSPGLSVFAQIKSVALFP